MKKETSEEREAIRTWCYDEDLGMPRIGWGVPGKCLKCGREFIYVMEGQNPPDPEDRPVADLFAYIGCCGLKEEHEEGRKQESGLGEVIPFPGGRGPSAGRSRKSPDQEARGPDQRVKKAPGSGKGDRDEPMDD